MKRINLCTLLLLVVLSFVITPKAFAQCDIFGPPYATSSGVSTAMGRDVKYVGVTFLTRMINNYCLPGLGQTSRPSSSGNGGLCKQIITGAGAFNCPGGGSGCIGLLALVPLTMAGGVPTMQGPHKCEWTCDCTGAAQVFKIDGDDGLPVELMEFSVDE